LLQKGGRALHHLSLGRYPYPDLTPLVRLDRLTHLAVGDSRRFERLYGIGALPALRHLSVYLCRNLASLAGIEAAPGLWHVDLDRCNRITDLAPLAAMQGLRSLQLEMRNPPPLVPFVGHASLEYVWVISRKQPPEEVVEALLGSPR